MDAKVAQSKILPFGVNTMTAGQNPPRVVAPLEEEEEVNTMS